MQRSSSIWCKTGACCRRQYKVWCSSVIVMCVQWCHYNVCMLASMCVAGTMGQAAQRHYNVWRRYIVRVQASRRIHPHTPWRGQGVLSVGVLYSASDIFISPKLPHTPLETMQVKTNVPENIKFQFSTSWEVMCVLPTLQSRYLRFAIFAVFAEPKQLFRELCE